MTSARARVRSHLIMSDNIVARSASGRSLACALRRAVRVRRAIAAWKSVSLSPLVSAFSVKSLLALGTGGRQHTYTDIINTEHFLADLCT